MVRRPAHRVRQRAVEAAVLGVLLLATIIGGSAVHATAATDDDNSATWGVAPAVSGESAPRAHFSYVVSPGESIEDAFVVTNYGEERLELAVYAADGFTTASGQLDLLAPGEASIDLGAWVRPSRSTITLDAGESLEVPFTIAIPHTATPGDHSGGIVTSLRSESAEGFDIERRLGSRIHVRVDGELTPALAIERFSVTFEASQNPLGAGRAEVRFRLVNEGNTRLTALQTIVISGVFGIELGTQALEVPELLPGTELDFALTFDDVVPLFWIQANLEVLPEVPRVPGVADGNPVVVAAVEASASAWAIPWALLAILGVVALIVLATIVVVRHRLRRQIAEAVEHAVSVASRD